LTTISGRLSALGLTVVPSVTNFYLIRFPDGCGTTASECSRRLEADGIIPRPVGGDDDAELRITVGSVEENEAVLRSFESLMKSSVSKSA
jgi:histidinol-phosphate aminotransferase